MLISGLDIPNFIFAGKCHCSIQNIESGNAFEYKIRQGNKPDFYFIDVRKLNSNAPYVKGGALYLDSSTKQFYYRKTSISKIDDNDISIKALLFVLHNYKSLPPQVRVDHFGVCGRCGRKLTDAESIHRGLGPECAKKALF